MNEHEQVTLYAAALIGSTFDAAARSLASALSSRRGLRFSKTVNAVPVSSLRDIYSRRLSRSGIHRDVASQGPNLLAAMGSPDEKWWVHTISSDDVRFVVFVRDGNGPTACLDLSALAPGSDGAD